MNGRYIKGTYYADDTADFINDEGDWKTLIKILVEIEIYSGLSIN